MMLRSIWPGWRQALLIGAVVLLAAALRLWAIGWGLPYVDHPDEPAVAESAFGMLRNHDWNPRFFDYPSFYLYALRVVFEAHWRYGLAAGLYDGATHLPHFSRPYLHPSANYLATPGFFLWGRALSALFGTLTVAIVYAVGRRWWSAPAGLAAAAVLATLPFHVRNSQYITVDAATAMTTLIAIAAALRLLDRGDLLSYALAGIGAGLAAATKYNAGAVVLSLLTAHAFHWGRAALRQGWRVLWAGLCAMVAFVALTPYSVLTYSHFMHGISIQYHDYAGGSHGDLLGRWPVGGYARFFLTEGLGPLPSLAAALGLGAVALRRSRAGLVVLAFVAPYLLFFLSWPEHFFRNLLPLFPPLALFAGVGIATAARYLARRLGVAQPGESNQRRLGGGLAAALALLVVGVPLVNAVQLDLFDTRADPRIEAGAYIEASLPRGAPIAAELNPAQLRDDTAVMPVASLAEHDLSWYRAHGIRYLVANTRYRTARTQAAFRQLLASSSLVATFDDSDPGRAIGLAAPLARTFASRYCGARVAVLDLQAAAGAAPGLAQRQALLAPSGAACSSH
jgi:hypothetical protein